MKIKEINIGKEFKCGLPNYSNITARADIKIELGENEEPDWNTAWDTINQQLSLQVDGLDPSWISTKEYGNFFKVITKIPKKKEV